MGFEQCGAWQSGPGEVEFKVFFPGQGLGPYQYRWGGSPQITSLKVFGSFQTSAWDAASAVSLARTPYLGGELWTAKVGGLPPNFYEYALLVTFNNGSTRVVGDPCTKYGGSGLRGTCGFVVDAAGYVDVKADPLPPAKRRSLHELVLYELMLDDFTAEFRGLSAPVAAMLAKPPGGIDKVEYIAGLCFNGIEFMPWTAWSDESFSWGYNPASFFAVEYRYVNDPKDPRCKIDGLKNLISACHANGLHVVMDGVFNHTVADRRGRGFGYCWLYQDPGDCPFIGAYGGGGFFEDLDYLNPCTESFIFDVCKYWTSEFQVDGLRLDYTKGYYDPYDTQHGLLKLVSDLRTLPLPPSITIEHLDGYDAIGACNRADADSCWYDPMYWHARDALYRLREWVKEPEGTRDEHKSPVQPDILRLLDSATGFDDGTNGTRLRAPTIYIENHDHAQIASNAEGWAHWERTRPWAIALFTTYGAVLCHNGQEMANDYYMPESGDGRVIPRPVLWWTELTKVDELSLRSAARSTRDLYALLASVRQAHPALTSRNFYPRAWKDDERRFNADGYGVDCERALVIYHRYTTDLSERIVVVLNFADYDQPVDVPLSAPGTWTDLLTGQTYRVDSSCRLCSHVVPASDGRVLKL
jgi:1,4-alpha-glucan branching enzyme